MGEFSTMKPRDAARVRLRSTGLEESLYRDPTAVVSAHLAMQSQDYRPAMWSIGQRVGSVSEAEVEREVVRGSILRTHVLRPTWHFVAREDLRWLLALSGPRVQQKNAPRYRELGLDAKTRARVERAVLRILEGGNALTRRELAEELKRSRLDLAGQRLPFALAHCELEAVICSGPPNGKQQTYALVDDRVPDGSSLSEADAIAELIRRYLTSHGPATIKDLTWWSGLKTTDLRRVLEDMGAEVHREIVDGLTLWMKNDLPSPNAGNRAVHLLQAYDELIVGYTESRYLGDPRARLARAAFKDRSMPTGVALSGTLVIGHWRRTIADRAVEAEVLLYEGTTQADVKRVELAFERLGEFVEREVRVDVGYLREK